ncbi:MAG: virulence factor [Hyphomicrobiaceae bacterium]|nr:virulence factor [Hyphomicrobiaceae bacterium]
MSPAIEATVIFWRDIPTQVVVGSGRRGAKRQLPDRFMVAVDKAAMVSGAASADDYLDDWRRATLSFDVPGDADPLAYVSDQLEKTYPGTRLAELARNGGREPNGTEQ